MDCFKAALEYLMRAALENLGLTGEVIVTKIEPEEQKEKKGGGSPAAERKATKEGEYTMDGMTLFFVLVGALTVAVKLMHLIDRLEGRR